MYSAWQGAVSWGFPGVVSHFATRYLQLSAFTTECGAVRRFCVHAPRAKLPELHTPRCEGCVTPYRSITHAGAGRGIPLAPGIAVHLVDVLIASTLLAAVCASLPAAFVAASRAFFSAGEATWTVVLAAQKVEELRSMPFPPPLEAFELLDATGLVVDGSRSAPVFRRAWRIAPLGAAPAQTVVITVLVAPYHGSAVMSVDDDPRDATRVVTLRTKKVP